MDLVNDPDHQNIEELEEVGKGLLILKYQKNGNVVSSFPVLEGEQLMLATDQGKIIRISVDGGEGNTIRVAGRKTQGVNLFTLADGEKVVSVDRVKEDEEDEEEKINFKVILIKPCQTN